MVKSLDSQEKDLEHIKTENRSSEDRLTAIEAAMVNMTKMLESWQETMVNNWKTTREVIRAEVMLESRSEMVKLRDDAEKYLSQISDNFANDIKTMKEDIDRNDGLIKKNITDIAYVLTDNMQASNKKIPKEDNKFVVSNGLVISSVENSLLKAMKELKWKNAKTSVDTMKWVYRVEETLSLYREQISDTQWKILKSEVLNSLFENTTHSNTGASLPSIEDAWNHFKRVENLTKEKLETIIVSNIVEYKRQEPFLRDDLIRLSGLIEFANEKKVILPSYSYLKAKVRDWIPASNLTNFFRLDITPASAEDFLNNLLDQIACLDKHVRGVEKSIVPGKKHDERKPEVKKPETKKGGYIDHVMWKKMTEAERNAHMQARNLKA
eukprot:GDKJ01004073.1.p1 GENE.GDKJ01004073.1~~GDKJ01004073.1.p1  ORF type:complete len:381 (+),score=44.42 GDKJ01004073.1:39-1181(+)